MREYLFSMHGVTVRLVTDHPAIAFAVQNLLRHFPREAADGQLRVELAVHGVQRRDEIPVSLSPAATFLAHSQRVVDNLLQTQSTIHQDGDRFIADFHAPGLVVLSPKELRADAYIIDPEAMHPDARASFCLFALSELLGRAGLSMIHAAALEKDGRAVLIPGFSGRGKTTSCISLLRGGYACLSDDHPFLRESRGGVELLPFPVKIDVTDKTIDFFPELRAARDLLSQGVTKRYFYAEELFFTNSARACTPAAIIFPEIIDWPQSHLEPLPKSRALEQILPHGLVALDRDLAKQRFRLLARLVEQTPCYRLYFGENVLDLPKLIDSVVCSPAAVA